MAVGTEEPELRSGIDDALVWKLYRVLTDSPSEMVDAARALPDDALLLAEVLDESQIVALQEAGFTHHFMPLDLAFLIAGPRQKERARTYRQEAYRIIGRPA